MTQAHLPACANDEPLQVQAVFSTRRLDLVGVELFADLPAMVGNPDWRMRTLRQLAAAGIQNVRLHLRSAQPWPEDVRRIWEEPAGGWPAVLAEPLVGALGATAGALACDRHPAQRPRRPAWTDVATLVAEHTVREQAGRLVKAGLSLWVRGVSREAHLRLAQSLGAEVVQGDLLARCTGLAGFGLRFGFGGKPRSATV